MNCTECNAEKSLLHGHRWGRGFGTIINRDEHLCDKCAEKRPGFLQSGDLLKAREKEYEVLATDRSKQ